MVCIFHELVGAQRTFGVPRCRGYRLGNVGTGHSSERAWPCILDQGLPRVLRPAVRDCAVGVAKRVLFGCLKLVRQRLESPPAKAAIARFTIRGKSHIAKLFFGGTHARKLNAADGVVKGFAHSGIIYQSSDVGSAILGGIVVAFNIQPWAWHYLKKHPELLK